jgi:hypothetical protein
VFAFFCNCPRILNERLHPLSRKPHPRELRLFRGLIGIVLKNKPVTTFTMKQRYQAAARLLAVK